MSWKNRFHQSGLTLVAAGMALAFLSSDIKSALVTLSVGVTFLAASALIGPPPST